MAAIEVDTGSVRIIIPDQTNPSPSYMKLSSTGRWLSYRSIPQLMDNPSKSSFDLIICPIEGDRQVTIIDENLSSEEGKDYIWHPIKDILVYEKDKKIHLVELGDKRIIKRRYCLMKVLSNL